MILPITSHKQELDAFSPGPDWSPLPFWSPQTTAHVPVAVLTAAEATVSLILGKGGHKASLGSHKVWANCLPETGTKPKTLWHYHCILLILFSGYLASYYSLLLECTFAVKESPNKLVQEIASMISKLCFTTSYLLLVTASPFLSQMQVLSYPF